MKFSIRSRLIILYIGTITLLFVAMFYFSYGVFSHAIFSSDIVDKFDREFLKRVDQVAGDLSLLKSPFIAEREEYQRAFNGLIGVDLLLNPAYGQLMDFPQKYGDPPLIIVRNDALGGRFIPLQRGPYELLKKGETAIYTVENVFPYPIRVFSKRIRDTQGNGYILQMGVSMENINTTMGNVLFKFLSVWPLLLLVISLMGYYFVKRSFDPVRKIVDTARSITAEDLSRRIPDVASADEIGMLAETLNEMIERIQRSFEQMRQFTDDAAHELRTPVTVIKGEIEVALRSKRSGEEYVETLRSLLEETEKLGGIIDNLLFLSRMDSRKIAITFQDVPLDELVMEVYEEFCAPAALRSVALSLTRVDEISVRGEPGLLKRLAGNLIQNAVKYTPPGGSVEISLRRPDGGEFEKGNRVVLIISDTGVGIPRKELPRIFDRFYRVDKSRSMKTGGSGLGLTIVKKILDIHGGNITVKSQPGKGTSFAVYLS